MVSFDYDAILVDTCIFSFFFKGDTRAHDFAPYLENKRGFLSFMTVAELYYWAHTRNWGTRRFQSLERAINGYGVLHSNDTVIRRWAYIRDTCRRSGYTINSADAWQASCALAYGLPFITNNVKDFDFVPGLILINP
ncbi:MAG: PIN domain-containing protein [Chloroflexi bacterium]|nr:PIN domain-containing protein [Chloroflexota bacterium]